MCNAENLNNMNMTFEPCIVLQNMLEIVDQIERVHTPKKKNITTMVYTSNTSMYAQLHFFN